jgi:hypothetical protein
MPWFAAHAVMWFRFKDGVQDYCPLWENILLIEAADFEEAERKAGDLAREEEGDSDGSLTCDDRPVTCIFAGLRKVVTVSHRESSEERPQNGDEVTYSRFEVSDEDTVRRFAAGETVKVEYVE